MVAAPPGDGDDRVGGRGRAGRRPVGLASGAGNPIAQRAMGKVPSRRASRSVPFSIDGPPGRGRRPRARRALPARRGCGGSRCRGSGWDRPGRQRSSGAARSPPTRPGPRGEGSSPRAGVPSPRAPAPPRAPRLPVTAPRSRRRGGWRPGSKLAGEAVAARRRSSCLVLSDERTRGLNRSDLRQAVWADAFAKALPVSPANRRVSTPRLPQRTQVPSPRGRCLSPAAGHAW